MSDLETRIRATLRDLADQADRSSSPEGMPKPFRRRVLRRRARTATIATLATGAVIAAAVAGVQWLSSGTTAQPANNPNTASYVNGAFAIARHDGIYQVQPDGSGLRKVADCPLPDCDGTASPAWSPDGSKIVFAALPKEGGAGEGLFVIDADGSGLVRLTCAPPGCSQDWDPAWSPDGSKIVFTRLGKGPLDQATIELYVVNADGSGLGRLADLPGYAQTPAWSPDGGRIAFDLQDENGQRIEVIRADGSHRSVIFQEPPGSGPGAPAWSPDGSRIAFVMASAEGGNPDIFVMNADGSHATRLTTDPSPDVDPVWSPDGSKIAFVRTGSGGELFVMDADGGDPQQLVVKDVLDMSWQALPAR